MEIKEKILKEIDNIPEEYLSEVLDFIHFLEIKLKAKNSLGIVSEASLKKDWLKPEEDEAWKNL